MSHPMLVDGFSSFNEVSHSEPKKQISLHNIEGKGVYVYCSSWTVREQVPLLVKEIARVCSNTLVHCGKWCLIRSDFGPVSDSCYTAG